MKAVDVPSNVIRRLPRYLRVLDELQKDHIETVSSGQLGVMLDLTPSQIRQDFNRFGEFGQQGYGYNVELLRDELSFILGVGAKRTAVLFGAGNLGHALLNNFNFNEYGFQMLAAFDVNPALVDADIAGVPVYGIKEFRKFALKNTIDIAVLAVPCEQAVYTAKEIVEAGVKGIWNFTNIELRSVEKKILIENIHFSDSLLSLGYYLTQSSSALN